METPEAAPFALLAWIARRRALGASDDELEAEIGPAAGAALADPRLAPLEARFAGRTAPVPAEPAARRRALLAAAVDQLLAQGRVAEAARLQRTAETVARGGGARRGAAFGETDDPAVRLDDPETPLEALAAEDRALWNAVGYDQWVVPPGSWRRPLASLTNEWVGPADRWRVLEELRRLDDPAETARVLAHFEKAGLDPGADHPAFRGVVPRRDDPAPPSPVMAGRGPGHPVSPLSVMVGPRADHPVFPLGRRAEALNGRLSGRP
jgi:hypothetical protein